MESVDALASRLHRLESLVGRGGTGTNVTRQLVAVSDKLAKIERDRPDVAKLYEHVDTVRKCADLAHIDKAGLDASVKWRVIETSAGNIFQCAEQLETLQEMKGVLDSEHIRHCGDHEEKMGRVARSQCAASLQIDRLVGDVSELISAYNHAVMSINRQLVLWDQTVTKMEVDTAIASK